MGHFDCWLAALASWKSVTRGKPVAKHDVLNFLYKYYPELYAGIDMDDKLNPAYLKRILEAEGMAVLEMKRKRLSSLGSNFLAKKLEYTHIYLAYHEPNRVGHAQVIYGVGHPTGKGEQISTMNPFLPMYENNPFGFFDKMTNVVLGWMFV
jgi:hypothetical protein